MSFKGKGSWKRPTVKTELAKKNWEAYEANRQRELARKKEESNTGVEVFQQIPFVLTPPSDEVLVNAAERCQTQRSWSMLYDVFHQYAEIPSGINIQVFNHIANVHLYEIYFERSFSGIEIYSAWLAYCKWEDRYSPSMDLMQFSSAITYLKEIEVKRGETECVQQVDESLFINADILKEIKNILIKNEYDFSVKGYNKVVNSFLPFYDVKGHTPLEQFDNFLKMVSPDSFPPHDPHVHENIADESTQMPSEDIKTVDVKRSDILELYDSYCDEFTDEYGHATKALSRCDIIKFIVLLLNISSIRVNVT